MKSVKIVALAGGLAMLLMGCPYESKIALGPAENSKPDKDMTGTFTEKDAESYTWTCKLEGSQYRIEKKNTEESESEPTIYIGWLTDVGGTPFLNVYEQDYESEKKYYFYRFEKKSIERFKFKAVTDNITEEFATSEELKAFVKKNMELSFFYNKDDEKTFYREDD
ncbi:MAG TPA: hypothetical protein VK826_20830 [Bacteroidia bacterium]|nr:hypothetical protein [Bacteroidia bacterium]